MLSKVFTALDLLCLIFLIREVIILSANKNRDYVDITFLLFVIFIFFNFFQSLLDENSLGYFLYLIPLSVFLIGCYNTLNYWLNRKKQYKTLSTNKVAQSFTSSTSSITFGIQDFGKDGLIISQLLAQAVVVALLIKKIKNYE